MKRSEMLELIAYHIYILYDFDESSALGAADQILTAQEQAGMVPPENDKASGPTVNEWEAE